MKGCTTRANPAAAVTRDGLEFVQLDPLEGGDMAIGQQHGAAILSGCACEVKPGERGLEATEPAGAGAPGREGHTTL